MQNKQIEVVGVGACNLDIVAFVPNLPKVEEKINARKYESPHAAGVCLDALTQLARLGIKCGMIGKIGGDALGEVFKKEMAKDNIDCSQLITVEEERSSFCWVIVDEQGNRCHVVFSMEQKGFLTEEEIEEREDYIKQAKVYHAEILQMPLVPMTKGAEICKKCDILVSFDLDIAPKYIYQYGYATQEELMAMIKLTDFLKVCKDGVFELISEENNMEKAAAKLLNIGPRIAVITMGGEGCVVAYENSLHKVETFRMPAFKVPVKDTTGAGDSFQGAFIYGILKGWEVKKITFFANACAALACNKIGARNMPTFEEIQKFLQKQGWKSIK